MTHADVIKSDVIWKDGGRLHCSEWSFVWGVWIPEPVDRFWVPSKQLSGLALGVSALRCWWKTSKYMDMFAANWHSETGRKSLLLLYISVYSKCCKTIQLTQWKLELDMPALRYAWVELFVWHLDIFGPQTGSRKLFQHPKLFLCTFDFIWLHLYVYCMYTVYTCFSWKELQRMIRLCEVGWAAGVNLYNDRVWYSIVHQCLSQNEGTSKLFGTGLQVILCSFGRSGLRDAIPSHLDWEGVDIIHSLEESLARQGFASTSGICLWCSVVI